MKPTGPSNAKAAPKADRKSAARMANLRKFIPNEQDEQLVKEMVKDGLNDDQILHALGYLNGAPDQNVLPEDHEYSHVPTDAQLEQQANEEANAQAQGGQAMTHLSGLLSTLGGGPTGAQPTAGGGKPQPGGQPPPRR